MQLAILNSTNNNYTGPDGINIRHLKHLGPLAIRYLTNIYSIALNTNTIPHLLKGVTIIHILKPNKNHNIGTNYRPISLLSTIAKTLEKTLLKYIIKKQQNISIISHQHGFKHKNSTHTALHNICHQITKSFNNSRPPQLCLEFSLQETWPHRIFAATWYKPCAVCHNNFFFLLYSILFID